LFLMCFWFALALS